MTGVGQAPVQNRPHLVGDRCEPEIEDEREQCGHADQPVAVKCVCGSIRYRLTGNPLTFYACHCTKCQTRTGSAFALNMLVLQTDLHIAQGAPEGSGESGERKRCSACATSLWREGRIPGVVWLRAGTLDDTQSLKPVAHIWTRSAQRWFALPEDVKAFETQPEDPTELVRLWHEANPSA
jgi:hypothetical protein